MPHDDHDLERELRAHRSEPREEFTENLAADVRGRRSHPSPRPRLTLAFALSLALVVSLAAFGGVGLASNAVHATTSAVKSATGTSTSRGGTSSSSNTTSAAKKQYHQKVDICYPITKTVVSYELVTVDKWVWKWDSKLHKKVKVKIQVRKKQLVRTKVVSYLQKTVSLSQVPVLVSKGAIYPVPRDGCWKASHPS